MKITHMIYIGLYPTFLILANLFGGTFIDIGSLHFSWAVIIFAGAFLLTDITKQKTKAGLLPEGFTETMYKAGIVVLIAFCILFFSIGTGATAEAQTFIYSTVRIFIASILSLSVSQRIDLWVFDVIAKRTTHKTRWIQNNISTITSSFIDTILFYHLAFLGAFSYKILITSLLINQSMKIIIALCDTPIFLFLTRKKSA